MKEDIYKAFSEVYTILEYSNEEIRNKIPNDFILLIKNNKDINHKLVLDEKKPLNEQKQLIETREILALIYRDYIVSQEERERLLIEEREEQKRIENEIREKYNPDNLFKERVNNNTNNNVEIVKYKESILKKLINKLKSIFI